MSYDNTACPCGSKKEQQTMICADCQNALKATREWQTLQDPNEPYWNKRPAAIKLLAMARRRQKHLALKFQP